MAKKKRKIPTYEELLAEDDGLREMHELVERLKERSAKLDAEEARRAQRWAWLKRFVRAA